MVFIWINKFFKKDSIREISVVKVRIIACFTALSATPIFIISVTIGFVTSFTEAIICSGTKSIVILRPYGFLKIRLWSGFHIVLSFTIFGSRHFNQVGCIFGFE